MNCLICEEPIRDRLESIEMNCQHRYHRDCFLNFCSRKNICPHCMVPEPKLDGEIYLDCLFKFLRKNMYIFIIATALFLFMSYNVDDSNSCDMAECYIRRDENKCFITLESKYVIVNEIGSSYCLKYNDSIVKCNWNMYTDELTLNCGHGFQYSLFSICFMIFFALSSLSLILDFFHKLVN